MDDEEPALPKDSRLRSDMKARMRRISEVSEKLTLPEWRAIPDWLRDNRARLKPQHADVDPSQLTESLAIVIATRRPISLWEALPVTERRRRATRIAKFAVDLANCLEEPDGPIWPDAIFFFEDANVPDGVQRGLGYSRTPTPLKPLFEQSVAPMLRRLAAYAERERHPRPRDTRPKTGMPDARVLAREVSKWFEIHFDHVPNAVVARVVNLALPQMRPKADEDSVREWRGAK